MKETIYHNRWNVLFPNNILNSKSRSRHHIRMLCLHSEMEQRGCCYGNGSVLESQIERQDFFSFSLRLWLVFFLLFFFFLRNYLLLVNERLYCYMIGEISASKFIKQVFTFLISFLPLSILSLFINDGLIKYNQMFIRPCIYHHRDQIITPIYFSFDCGCVSLLLFAGKFYAGKLLTNSLFSRICLH